MPKRSNRLWLRVAPDNPIWDIEVSERSAIADCWLRIGCNTERLEKAITELNRQIQLISSGHIKMETDKPIEKNVLQDEIDLIHSIMNTGDKK